MLDSGHTDKDPGALGVRGEYEKHYNDLLIQEVYTTLSRSGRFKVSLTHKPGEELSLKERVSRANAIPVDLLLSLHHNAVSESVSKEAVFQGKSIRESMEPVSGYSLYVSQENPKFTGSLLFATDIGAAMEEIERYPFQAKPSLQVPGSQRLMNTRFGIFQYDALGILRSAHMPAVLFEVGFIVDRNDEQWLSQNRTLIAQQLAKAITRYAERKS